MRIDVTRGRLPLPPGWIDEPLLPEPVRLSAGRSRARVRVEVTFARRGRRLLAPPALVLRDPFGLAQRVVGGARVDEVLVLPRVLPVRAKAGGGEGVNAHARAALIAAAETEIDGLREHREGSPASRIHWPTVARGAGLMERKLISEADSRPLVVLDPRAPASQDALDAAVRAAASLTVHFARRTGCGLVMPGDRRALTIDPDLLAWPQAHVRLALMEDNAGPGAHGRPEPARPGRVRRRARRRPAAARTGPHAGWLPDRGAGRDRRPSRRARGGRLPGLRRRPHRQRRGDGRGRGRRMSRGGLRPEHARCTPAGSRGARGGRRRRAAAARPGARPRPGRRSSPSRACTGCRCSNPPSPGGHGRRSGSPCSWCSALLGAARLPGALRAGRRDGRRARRGRARPARGRRGRRVPAPGPLERAAGRRRPRYRGAARRARALPRRRRVDPAR